MPNFQRKQVPFLHRGMNWNAPAEKLAEGQVQWAKNARVYEQGVINGAHGFTQRYVPPDITPSGFLHSYARLNILSPSFDAGLDRSYVLGMDGDLFVFQDNASLNNSALNPVSVPGGPFSGNPLSIVDMQPVGAAAPWKYIGDSNTMVSTGYFPEDHAGAERARCLSMGLPLPYNQSAPPFVSGSGNLNGSYQWCFAYRRLQTGARSNPSAATRATIENPPTTGTNFQIQVQLPNPPLDTGDAAVDITIDVYRFGGTIARWALVGSGAPGSTFFDNTPDEALLAAPAPPQITDQATGLTRFNMYQPFVTQDVSRSGANATLARPDSLTPWTIGASVAWPAPGSFNPNWLPGSTIYINGIACTMYQIDSSGLLIEIMDDLTGQLAPGPVGWYTDAGTLQSGQPLPHLWGPYGIGQSGSYIFGCGDPNGRGTLYWTNGNDPDSTDVVNNIIVTSPSEKLVTGCVYSGQPYAWSTERQFQVFPSLTIFGQFTTQEVAGAKGCWLEWSLSVQNNGVADQSVTWRGKDGIYDMSAAAGLQRLTDPLYGFFPHDGNPGLAPETLIVQIASYAQHPETVGNLDDTQPKYHRLEWFQGMLYYDFVALTTQAGQTVNTFSTLVWDTVQIPGGGWVSLDQPFANTNAPVFRSSEIGANQTIDTIPETGPIGGPASRGGNLAVLRSRDPSTGETIIYDYFGYTRGFEVRVITKAEDIGDSRAPKAWGDYWVDCIPINPITFYPLYDYNIGPLLPSTANPGQLPGPPSQRSTFVFDFQEFKPLGPYPSQLFLNPSLGLDIRWTAADGQFSESIIQWQPSYIPKPEFFEFRATDPNDGGIVQAKYLMGANIEANTLNVPIEVALYVDTQPITVLKMQHNYQSILPYAWEPVAGYEFVVQLFVGPTVNALQIFNINWIFEPWPDFVARKYPFTNLGDTSDKFIQGIVLPMETGGNPCTVGIRSDDNPSVTQQWTKTTPNLVKTGVVLNIEQPFTAHFLQFQTITPGRIWPNEARVVFEPIPEVVNTWQTQQTDFDMGGWSSLRDCFIAYMGNGDAPILSITTEYGTVQYPLDLMAVGQYTRCYRVLQPQKAKWHSFRLESSNGVRLYQKDTVIRAKEWGSIGPYINIQPFGDLSRTQGARM